MTEKVYRINWINHPVVDDADIELAFTDTNFGDVDRRHLLQQGVLKFQANFSSGYTLTTIMKELGLVTPKGRISKKGRRFLFQSFFTQDGASIVL